MLIPPCTPVPRPCMAPGPRGGKGWGGDKKCVQLIHTEEKKWGVVEDKRRFWHAQQFGTLGGAGWPVPVPASFFDLWVDETSLILTVCRSKRCFYNWHWEFCLQLLMVYWETGSFFTATHSSNVSVCLPLTSNTTPQTQQWLSWVVPCCFFCCFVLSYRLRGRELKKIWVCSCNEWHRSGQQE